jgi:hypothetical protein
MVSSKSGLPAVTLAGDTEVIVGGPEGDGDGEGDGEGEGEVEGV